MKLTIAKLNQHYQALQLLMDAVTTPATVRAVLTLEKAISGHLEVFHSLQTRISKLLQTAEVALSDMSYAGVIHTLKDAPKSENPVAMTAREQIEVLSTSILAHLEEDVEFLGSPLKYVEMEALGLSARTIANLGELVDLS